MKEKEKNDKLQASSKEKEEKSKLQIPKGTQALDEEGLKQVNGGTIVPRIHRPLGKTE